MKFLRIKPWDERDYFGDVSAIHYSFTPLIHSLFLFGQFSEPMLTLAVFRPQGTWKDQSEKVEREEKFNPEHHTKGIGISTEHH